MRMKRFLASLLALLMLFSLMQVFALAEGEEDAGQISLVGEEETEPGDVPEADAEIVPEADEPEILPVEDDPMADPVAYDLWVCGVQVTSENKNMIAGTNGLRFNPDTATLTVYNTSATALTNPELYNGAVIYSELPELTISFASPNLSMQSDTAEYLIYANGGDVTLLSNNTGLHTLTSASATYGIYVVGGDLTIDSYLRVTAPAAEYGFFIENGDLLLGKVTINYSTGPKDCVPVVLFDSMQNGVGIANGAISGTAGLSSSTVTINGKRYGFSFPTLQGDTVENAMVVTNDEDLSFDGQLRIYSKAAQFGVYVPKGTVTNTANLNVSLVGDTADSCIYAEKGFTSNGALSVDCYECDGGYGIKVMDGDVTINGETISIGAEHTGIYCGNGDVTIAGFTAFAIYHNEEGGLCPSSGIYTANGSITMGAFDLFGGANWVLYANGPIHITDAINVVNEGDLLGGNGIKSTRGGIVIDGDTVIEAINCIDSEGEDGILIGGNATIKANGRYGINAGNGPITVAGNLDVRGASFTAVTAKGDITVGGNVYASASTPSQFPEFPGNAMESTDGSINVTGNLNCYSTKNPVYAKNDIYVGGNALTSAAVGSNSVAGDFGINAETGTLTVDGTLTCKGKANISVFAGKSITVKQSATITNAAENSIGMVTDGTVTFVTGKWDVDATAAAIQAAEGIEIAEGYGVTLPRRGKVALLDGVYTVTETDGATVAAHAIISEVLPPVTVVGKSLSLEGKIALNFYLDIPAAVLASPGAYVEIGGEKLPISEAEYLPVRGESGYRFTVKVKFAQLTEDRILRVYDGNNELIQLLDLEGNDLTETGLVYRAQDYIEYVRENTEDKGLLKVVDTLSDVGSLAQAQFKYNEDLRVPVVGDLAAVTAADVEGFKPTLKTAEDSQVKYYGSSLLLQDVTTLRHYFKADAAAIENCVFTVDGHEVTPEQKGGYYYIDIHGIVAKDLDKSFHVEVTCDGTTLIELDYSALSYSYGQINTGKTTVLTDLAKAVYLYGTAADEYFTD